MNIDLAIAELERSPDLLDHFAHFEKLIQDEQRRREQFYHDLDEGTKAEFINGQVVMHSPVRRPHLQASFLTANLLGNFALQRGLGEVYLEKCFMRCRRNDYEPDICFFGTAKCTKLDKDQLIFPPPDLIVEVLSPSTETNDRTVKLHDYARHGGGEYWIVDDNAKFIEQYVLPPGTESYELKAHLTADEQLISAVLAGFAVLVVAMFDGPANLRALQTFAPQP